MSGQKLASAYVEIRAMVDHLRTDLAGGTSMVRGWLGSVQGLAAAIGIGLGINEIRGIFSAAVHSYEEAETVATSLKAVLEGTGEAAGFSFEEMNAFASELEAKTTIADDAWLGVMRNMGRFDSVAGDVFKRAIELSGDLAIAMGQGPGGAAGVAVQLGKALEDPAHGLRRLIRLGIKFSDEETKRIKQLAASGNLLKAQELILAKIEKYKGSAALLAGTDIGQLAQAKNALDNIYEVLGKKVLPLYQIGVQIQKSFASSLVLITSAINPLIRAVLEIDKATGGWLATMAVAAAFLATGIASIIAFVAILGGIAAGWTAAGVAVAAFAATLTVPLGVFVAIVAVAAVLQIAIVAIVAAVAAAGIAFGLWVLKTKAVQEGLAKIRASLVHAWNVISTALIPAAEKLMDIFDKMREGLGSWKDTFADVLSEVLDSLSDFVMDAAELIAMLIKNMERIPAAMAARFVLATAPNGGDAAKAARIILDDILLELAKDLAKLRAGRGGFEHFGSAGGDFGKTGDGNIPETPKGFMGFEELNRKFQEAQLKADDPMAKLVGLEEENNAMQKELLDVAKETRDKIGAGGLETAKA